MIPSRSALSRALRRAETGATLDVTEATTLLHATGEEFDRLLAAAALVRDAHLTDQGHPGVLTYSRNVFIPLTRLCRDRCHYCTFVTVPGKVPHSLYLERDEVVEIARKGAELGCKEALFTLGDRPEARWPQAREWLEARGYSSTVDYVRACAIAVLEETGLLPHLNPGVLSWVELQRLKPGAARMGAVVETTAARLGAEGGGPHHRLAAVVGEGRPALRLAGQGTRGPVARARRRRPGRRAVHHRDPDRDRGEPRGAGRVVAGHPAAGPAVPQHPGSHRAELPGQAGDRDAVGARCLAARPGGRGGRCPAAHAAGGVHPGSAEPHRRGARAAAACGHRRLGWRLPGDPGPRESRTSVARVGDVDRVDRGGRLRTSRAPDGVPALRACCRAVDRRPVARACAGA